MINVDISSLVGQTFTVIGSDEYQCLGVGQNDTIFVMGVKFDSVSNRSTVHTFKMKEVTFKGKISPKIAS